MKKKITIFLVLIKLFSGCTNESEKDKEIEKLKTEKRHLEYLIESKDSIMNKLFFAFNQIENNLQKIVEKENTIKLAAKSDVELQADQRERINQEITAINDLMIKNKKTIAFLTKKLKEHGIKIAEFEKMVKKLQKQLEEKNTEIALLKEELIKMNFTIESLNKTIDTLVTIIDTKEEIITQQTKKMNKAWYAYGTAKELIEKGVITKEGGVIGLGKTEKLKEDFNKDYFSQIDITQTKKIELNVKKARIITSHPKNSYKFIENNKIIESLEILDPEEFWSVSKYLVIIVE